MTEVRIRTKSGKCIVGEFIMTPQACNGIVTEVLGIGRDITERKRMEDALRKSEAHFRAIASSANDAIISTDGVGNIIFWNKAASAMFGYTDQDAVGMPLKILMPEADREAYGRSLQRLLKSGETNLVGKSLEMQALRKDGSQFPVEHSIATWNTEAGQFFTGIIRDTTERKKAEEDRERLIGELQESLASIKTLSGLLPICAGCKKIRDDRGYWNQVEKYLKEHTDVQFTHGMCPECMQKYYPELYRGRN